MSTEYMYVWDKNTKFVDILNTLKSIHLNKHNFLQLGKITDEETLLIAENIIDEAFSLEISNSSIYFKALDLKLIELRTRYNGRFFLRTVYKTKIHNTEIFYCD